MMLKEDKGKFYDDCPVCLAQKKADEEGRDITENEILEAFEKSKKKGAVVGKISDEN